MKPELRSLSSGLLGLLGIAASIIFVYVGAGMKDDACKTWMLLTASIVAVAALFAIAEALS